MMSPATIAFIFPQCLCKASIDIAVISRYGII